MAVLQSEWTGLNKNLIAVFFVCDNKGKSIGSDVVCAPLTEASCDITFGWSSPFENSGADSKAPALSAMLQSGSLKETIDSLGGSSEAKGVLQEAVGRTGITKLNSTQIFTGMQPVKISVTLLFRAWSSPKKEVEDPINKLMQWSLPRKLAKDGATVNAVKAAQGKQSMIEAALPSETPQFIGMTYKGKTYAPLVIESISNPLNNLIDKNGNRVEVVLPMSLGSLTAWDANDWKAMSNVKKG
jgi:hypothetical protein